MHKLKRLWDIAGAVRIAQALGSHDHWTRKHLLRHQEIQLDRLVRHAVKNAPFFTELYRDIDLSRPVEISRLPVLNKRVLMENFDEAVTDRQLTMKGVRAHLETLSGDDFHLDTYRVVATAGTSGFRGYFVYDRRAWRVVLANTLRWNSFLGIHPRWPWRIRIASIGADDPMHVTERIPQSGDTGLFRVKHFLATDPISDIARGLQEFRPDVILAYPSIAALIAVEQIEGRIQISPRVVSTHSEMLSGDMYEKIKCAWSLDPFNHYGLTEEPHVAADCRWHEGLHIFEDTSVVEIVDADNRPVPDGVPGSKYLLTNLYNLAQPIIRYEVTDVLTRASRLCTCRRPFALIKEIGGRSEDVLYLPAIQGKNQVPIAPLSIEMCIEAFHDVAEYAVVHSPKCIEIKVVSRRNLDDEAFRYVLSQKLQQMILKAGAVPPQIKITLVEKLERQRERMGKLRLVGAASSHQHSGPPPFGSDV